MYHYAPVEPPPGGDDKIGRPAQDENQHCKTQEQYEGNKNKQTDPAVSRLLRSYIGSDWHKGNKD